MSMLLGIAENADQKVNDAHALGQKVNVSQSTKRQKLLLLSL